MKLIYKEFDRYGKPQKPTKEEQLGLLNSITEKN